MTAMSATPVGAAPAAAHRGHALWVRLAHWLIVVSVVTLIYSGIAILVAHPRLYWGQAGNSLTRPLIELPLGPNYHTVHFGPATQFFGADGPVSRSRTADVFNLNSWARSLHFLVAWTLAVSLGAYWLAAVASGHLVRWLIPSAQELSPSALAADVRAHLSLHPPRTSGGPPYNLMQKLAYLGVAVVGLPVMVVTGLSMSPAITAAFPGLMDLTGGYQSARTIHFAMMAMIVLFLVVHLTMMALTGFVRQLRAMTWGG
jgi:thiosulfate reductase cytochrome b subunit